MKQTKAQLWRALDLEVARLTMTSDHAQRLARVLQPSNAHLAQILERVCHARQLLWRRHMPR